MAAIIPGCPRGKKVFWLRGRGSGSAPIPPGVQTDIGTVGTIELRIIGPVTDVSFAVETRSPGTRGKPIKPMAGRSEDMGKSHGSNLTVWLGVTAALYRPFG
jgi:hypothetical protein